MISKKEVLDNLDTVKKYIEEAENKKEEKTVGIQIKNHWEVPVTFCGLPNFDNDIFKTTRGIER